MTRRLRIVLLAGMGLLVVTALGYEVNKDLINLGATAKGIVVVFDGQEQVDETYDDEFPAPGQGGEADTSLHWQFPSGGSQIPTNDIVHVGWSTTDGSSNVKDMYWTDEDGNRLPDNAIHNVTPEFILEHPELFLEFLNLWPTILAPEGIDIEDVRCIVTPEPWPLAELNWANTVLNSMLDASPLPGGELIHLDPLEAVQLSIPATAEPGSAVILRYTVAGPSALATDWVQWVVTMRGDTNCDGQIDAFDIDAFVLALTDPAAWQTQYDCGFLEAADINGDGCVNSFDIDPFVELLTGG